jgi:hypothetical protein
LQFSKKNGAPQNGRRFAFERVPQSVVYAGNLLAQLGVNK